MKLSQKLAAILTATTVLTSVPVSGHTDTYSASVVDTIAPTLSLTYYLEDDLSAAIIIAAGNDNETGTDEIEYSIGDNIDDLTWVEECEFYTTENGTYTIHVRDKHGNMTSETITVTGIDESVYKEIVSVEIKDMSQIKTDYMVGEPYHVSGELLVTYDDNTTTTVPITIDMVDQFHNLTPGKSEVIIRYKWHKIQYTIDVGYVKTPVKIDVQLDTSIPGLAKAIVSVEGDFDYVLLPTNQRLYGNRVFGYYLTDNGVHTFTAVGKDGYSTHAMSVEVNEYDDVAPIMAFSQATTSSALKVTITDPNYSHTTTPNGETIHTNEFEYDLAKGQGTFTAYDTEGNATSRSYEAHKEVTIGGSTNPTTISFAGIPTEWTNKDIDLALIASNSVDGIDAVSLGGKTTRTTGTTTSGVAGTTVSGNGQLSYTIQPAPRTYEDTIEISKIDKDAPTVQITQNGNIVTIVASDSQSGIKRILPPAGERFEGNGQSTMTETFVFDAEGEFKVIVEDMAGNKAEETFTFTYDPTIEPEPEPEVPSDPSEPSEPSPEPEVPTEPAPEPEVPSEPSEPTPEPDQTPDNEDTDQSTPPTVDTTAPTITKVDQVKNNDTVTIVITAVDDTDKDKVLYSMDGKTYTSSNTFEVKQNGIYNIFVKDTAGNVTQAAIKVESFQNPAIVKEPVITKISHTLSSNKREATIKVEAKDYQGDKLQYSIDGKTWQDSNEFKVNKNGTYKLSVKDTEGNTSVKEYKVSDIKITTGGSSSGCSSSGGSSSGASSSGGSSSGGSSNSSNGSSNSTQEQQKPQQSMTTSEIKKHMEELKENLPFTLPTGAEDLSKYQSGKLDAINVAVKEGKTDFNLKLKDVSLETVVEGVKTVGKDITFSDVTTRHWAHDDIKKATQAGFLKGVSETHYSPKATLNYADTLTGLNRVLMVNYELSMANSRTTVLKAMNGFKQDHWAFNHTASILSKLEKDTLTRLTEKGESLYTREMTRGELAEILMEITDNLNIPATMQMVHYNDLASTPTAISYVARTGLMKGDNKGNFNAEKTLTRAELSTVLNRLNQILTSTKQ